jgi:hypothetical protein
MRLTLLVPVHRQVDEGELEERLAPLFRAAGSVVLHSAVLETLLLTDIVQRCAHADDSELDLVALIEELEGRSMGRLAGRLRMLGIDPALADRLADVVHRRNRVVHHLLKDPSVLRAVFKGEGMDEVVTSVEQVAADCRAVGAEIVSSAFAGMESLFTEPVADTIEKVQKLEIQQDDPESLKELAAFAEHIDPADVRALLRQDLDETDQ